MPSDDSVISPVIKYEVERNQSSENDVKEFRKKLRNRQSAQRARDRQKARMRWLEREVALLTMRNQALASENSALRNLLGDGVCDSLLRRDGDPAMKGINNLSQNHTDKTANTAVDDHAKNEIIQPLQNKQTHPHLLKSQSKSVVINGKKNQHLTASAERVAVISPMARPNGHFPFQNSSDIKEISEEGTLTQVRPHKKSVQEKKSEIKRADKEKLGGTHDAFLRASESTRYGDSEDCENAGKREQPLSMAASHNPFSLPFSESFLAANYYPLMSGGYLAPYLHNAALAQLVPQQMLNGSSIRPEEGRKSEQPTRNFKNAGGNHPHRGGTLLHPESMLLRYADPYSTSPSYSFLNGMAGILPKKSTRKGNTFEKVESCNNKLSVQNPFKRFKMNSFESECSSQVSSEPDTSAHSPQC